MGIMATEVIYNIRKGERWFSERPYERKTKKLPLGR